MLTEETGASLKRLLPPAPSTSHLLQSNVNKGFGPKVPAAHANSTQQNDKNVVVTSQPNLPCRDLLTGPREVYLETAVPLYEASIKCDWKAAKAILDRHEEPLLKYCIGENGETALHIAASTKVPKLGVLFVKNLVDLMNPEDLALENENFNTALYLAAAAGNLETVKIMVEKNRDLVKIPGAGRQMFPLYAATLFGHYDVVMYLFEKSSDLCDADGWNDTNRGWFLQKCVENDMFDVALQIVKMRPNIGRGTALGILAGKPEAFPGTRSNIFRRTIKPVLTFILSKVGNCEKVKNALPLLRAVWNDIVKLPKKDMDRILRGPPDPIKQDKSASGRAVQAIQLQNLISEHLDKLLAISEDTLKITQDTKPVPGKKLDQALRLQKLISAQLASMHVETQNVIKGTPDTLALELEKLIFEHIVKLNETTQKIINVNFNNLQKAAQSLHKAIIEHIYSMDKERQRIIKKPAKDAYSNRVLFIAAETGNTNFIVELIRLYPDLIWKVNDDGLSIFHVAIKHRHAGIFNLLYEIGAMKDLITPLKDPKQNNMLHLVGMSAKKNQREDVLGVALEMQRELLWFKEVKKMIPPSYRERKNADGLTPHELFTKEHQELVTEGDKWVKKVAAQCIVVAALVATMVFTAAFTVPGGYDQTNGIPIFHSKLSFQIFVVADAISLFLSTASILYMFLAVFTSHYGERDFLVSVPKKLRVGLTFLFLSITSMMIAFCTSFFLLYHKALLWMAILISIFALIPFFLYIMVQIPLTFGSRNLFNPKKRVLYYENPKF